MNPRTLSLDFPAGLIGCPEWRRFRLVQDLDSAPIASLECLDQPGLSFLVVDPRLWVPGYSLRSAAEPLAAAGLPDSEKLLPLVILNVQADPLQVTANLLGPLAVDPESGQGAQVVVTDQPYSAEQPVTPEAPESDIFGADDDFQYIVDENSFWIGYVEPQPRMDAPTAIARFAWTGLIPGVMNKMGGVITRGRDDRAYSDWIHSRNAFDIKVVAPDLGLFFTNAVIEA